MTDTPLLDRRLDDLSERVRATFTAKHQARERALSLCRDVIRHAALTIRAVHRGEAGPARGLLAAARDRLAEARAAVADHTDIYHAGFIHDAQKEFAEASLTLALVEGEAIPLPEDLDVEYAAYLNGMGEAVGELRRYVLDSLRHGDMERCERLLGVMDDIYALMVTIDYPDAITGGLRRTTDVTRGILERTRGDLTMAARQNDLERRLARFESMLAR
ncbi:MAG: haloacid dehalogenase [Dehalococcoidia bacterium]